MRRRGSRIAVHVKITGNRKYGYLTQETIYNKHKDALGITKFAGASGVFFGANAPKPPRATFDFATGAESTFCSEDKTAELRKTGWTITRPGSIRGVKTAGKTRTVYVEMPGGWLYAWNITASEADLADELGFVLATGADASNLVWGVGNPKPPRASRRDNSGTVSTFIKPQQSVIDAAVGAGWTVSSVDYDLLPSA